MLFNDIKPQLLLALYNRRHAIDIKEDITLLDGFYDVYYNWDTNIVCHFNGSKRILVAVQGNESGRIFYFSLESLLSE